MSNTYKPPREIGHVLVPDKGRNLNTLVDTLTVATTRTAPPPTVDAPEDGPLVFTTRSTLRRADSYATQTLVINHGAVPVMIYENNLVVGVAPVAGTLTLRPGKGLIEGEGIGDSWSASVTVRTTHGSTPHGAYPEAVEPDPVGSFLL